MHKINNLYIKRIKKNKNFVDYILILKFNKKNIYTLHFNKLDYIDKYYNINKLKNKIIISNRQFEYYLLLNNLHIFGYIPKIFSIDEYNII